MRLDEIIPSDTPWALLYQRVTSLLKSESAEPKKVESDAPEMLERDIDLTDKKNILGYLGSLS